jgi:hypothetical protein
MSAFRRWRKVRAGAAPCRPRNGIAFSERSTAHGALIDALVRRAANSA